MCNSSPDIEYVEPAKAAKPAATPPSPTESPTAPEEAGSSGGKKKKSTAKGKLALRSDVNAPAATGLNIFQ